MSSPFSHGMIGSQSGELMRYIIAGSNLSNSERPVVTNTVETAFDALHLVGQLQSDGYQVRIATSDGDEVTTEDLKARVAAGERLSAGDRFAC
ncbi:hypothetical protein [Methylobacterium nodulans]|uniref:Uncharacterized protein n=1 Tax=Methylobacterium nodulans (strain LMG 21967 / CNCM I-2342 / ORS 2060) TaxID=460265 RepID=B8IUL6_METNO|nr:hypothetical protein [Methylobacterium nodulans]ACL57084.1 hypothetical protein Mnod_2099 [Methylobacterium nodulans ORS 2060]